MGLNDIVRKLKERDGIRAVFLLEGESLKKTVDEEKSIETSSMGIPLVNRALEECLKRNTFLCLFCDHAFETAMDHVIVMEDGDGNIIGHDVPPCMMDDFKDDPNIIWLSDDFAMFPNISTCHEFMIVMLPQKVTIIGESDGVRDPILLYPSTTTDMVLKKIFGSPAPNLSSAIIAFDL